MTDWKAVVDFPRYEVSEIGEIRNLETEQKLKPWLRDGYLIVGLRGEKGRRIRSVHVIVAEAFIGPRPQNHHCAHLDGNRGNPRVSNLAWVTPTENEAHKVLHGTSRKGKPGPRRKFSDEQAEIIREIAHAGIRLNKIARERIAQRNKRCRPWADIFSAVRRMRPRHTGERTMTKDTVSVEQVGLKPCPFCGGEAKWDCMSANAQHECTEWSPECSHCGATIILDRPCGKHEAAAAWNTRADTEATRQAIAERDEALRFIEVLIDNDPDEPISDAGHTVLDMWRHDAKRLLAKHRGQQ